MKLSRLFQQMPDIVVCRDQDRAIQIVNTAFIQAFGKNPEDWIGKHLDGAVSGAQIGAFDENRAYGHIQIKDKLHWVEWIETPLSEGGSLAVGRLNSDRRQKNRSFDEGRICRRTEPKNTYQLPEHSTQTALVQNRAPFAQTATRILLAEDDLLNAKLACALLEQSGCLVTHVETGKEAVQQAVAHEFDMVFMDIRMPQMDGLTATKAIRKLGGNWKTIPIVALTANAFTEDRKSCHQAGMNGFLTKPISIDALDAAKKRWTNDANSVKTG